MLELVNVTKIYKTKEIEVKALDGVSITFPTSGLVFINGKSGCGKTTLLNVIGGLDGVNGGEIFVQDKKLSDFSSAEYDAYRNTFIGFIFQEYNLLPEFTVEKNIKFAMELQGGEVDEAEFEKLLADMEITNLKTRKISELSGGQRQRVAIARALIKKPHIIMADEPTGAVDSATGIQVLEILKKISKDKLVIVVSHDVEFAEKYADRIIHLIDGKIESDVSFVEKELPNGLTENEDAVFVREGARLSDEEKDFLARAVYERRRIEIIKTLNYRKKEDTGVVTREVKKPEELKTSKMKLRSAVRMGIKSLAVKPIRLLITVLISALAFAVFALFDTIANFSTLNVLKNQLKTSPLQTVVATTDYVVDRASGDEYAVKISNDTIDELEGKTGGKVKGIFNLSANTQGNVKQDLSVSELSSETVVGKRYYADSVIGFMEFDAETELWEDGEFKDFDYTLICGEYPKLAYEEGAVLQESMYQVAISTYFADSLIYHLNGKSLNEKQIRTREDLIGATITVERQEYTITGLIDCGQIPEKYAPLQRSMPNDEKTKTLIEDFEAYISSGAQICLFAPQGFLEEYNKKRQSADVYYVGNSELTLSFPQNKHKQVDSYVLHSGDYDAENIVLFNDKYGEDGQISLADDEILIHSLHLQDLYSSELWSISPKEQREYAKKLIADMSNQSASENRAALKELFSILEIEQPFDSLSGTIRQYFTQTGVNFEKEIKVVGVFFNIDLDNYISASNYKIMMNKNLMRELNVFSGQGDYAKVLFSSGSVHEGLDAIAEYLAKESGLTLNWYNNSVLLLIKENEALIRQAADLFLWVTLALGIVSVFMLYNYMSTSIASKKRSVGVLRALGAGRKDILLTFLSESLIISLFNGVLANVFAVLGVNLANKYVVEIMNISVHFALFGIRQILIISIISLLTGILSSLLPICKIAKKSPVELIRVS